MLKRLGFSVFEAKDGAEAVEVFRRRHAEIQCVVSDLTMPVLDGWKTIEALRALRPGLPAVLASGYDKARVMAGEHSEWPQEYLRKPHQLSELRGAIHGALAGK